ncbi:M20 family metallopeptidase (plasmid) [Mesorhizobium sp. ORM8.1]
MLNGHIDVVPTGDAGLWTHAPFSGNRSEGYIWGRGSADMKGGLLCGIFAVHALREVGISLNRDIQIQCVVGEETTSIGSHYALATQPRPSAVIVLEPSDNCVISTCGGSMHFEIEAYGRAAHTAVSWTGHSAMETLWDIYSGLKTWSVSPQNPVVPPPDVAWPRHDPFAVGRFQGGEWLATLPESAQMIGRIGVHPSQTIEQLKGAFEKAFSDISARSANASRPAMVRWLDQGTPSWTTSPAEDLVRSLLEANYLAGGTDRPHGATYGSDAAVFASAGIPTVLFGPGTISDAHVVDEKVSEEALISATRTLALAIARIASRDGR